MSFGDDRHPNTISMKELCCLFCCPPLPSRIAAKLAFLPPEPTYTLTSPYPPPQIKKCHNKHAKEAKLADYICEKNQKERSNSDERSSHASSSSPLSPKDSAQPSPGHVNKANPGVVNLPTDEKNTGYPSDKPSFVTSEVSNGPTNSSTPNVLADAAKNVTKLCGSIGNKLSTLARTTPTIFSGCKNATSGSFNLHDNSGQVSGNKWADDKVEGKEFLSDTDSSIRRVIEDIEREFPSYGIHLGPRAEWQYGAKELDRLEAFTTVTRKGSVIPCLMVRCGAATPKLSFEHREPSSGLAAEKTGALVMGGTTVNAATNNVAMYDRRTKLINSAELPVQISVFDSPNILISSGGASAAPLIDTTSRGKTENEPRNKSRDSSSESRKASTAKKKDQSTTQTEAIQAKTGAFESDQLNNSGAPIETGFVRKEEQEVPAATIHIDNSNYKQRYKPTKYTILFSHGNAVDLGQMSSFYLGLGTKLGCDVVGYDYSGYGQSYALTSGKFPFAGHVNSSSTNCFTKRALNKASSRSCMLRPNSPSKELKDLNTLRTNSLTSAARTRNLSSILIRTKHNHHNNDTKVDVQSHVAPRDNERTSATDNHLKELVQNDQICDNNLKTIHNMGKSIKPSEANLYADAEAALKAIIKRFDISPDRIVLYGQSIGTVPTIHLASSATVAALGLSKSPAGVILHSPLISGLRVAFPFLLLASPKPTAPASMPANRPHPDFHHLPTNTKSMPHSDNNNDIKNPAYTSTRTLPSNPASSLRQQQQSEEALLLRDLPKWAACVDAFYTPDKLKRITGASKVLVIHGTVDDVIDYGHGRAVYSLIPSAGAVEPLWVAGAGHNDIEMHGEYLARLKRFFRDELPS